MMRALGLRLSSSEAMVPGRRCTEEGVGGGEGARSQRALPRTPRGPAPRLARTPRLLPLANRRRIRTGSASPLAERTRPSGAPSSSRRRAALLHAPPPSPGRAGPVPTRRAASPRPASSRQLRVPLLRLFRPPSGSPPRRRIVPHSAPGESRRPPPTPPRPIPAARAPPCFQATPPTRRPAAPPPVPQPIASRSPFCSQ